MPPGGREGEKKQDVRHDGDPELPAEACLLGLMAETLLGEDPSRPATRERENVERCLGNASATPLGARLVEGVGDDGDKTRDDVDEGSPPWHVPVVLGCDIASDEKHDRKQIYRARSAAAAGSRAADSLSHPAIVTISQHVPVTRAGEVANAVESFSKSPIVHNSCSSDGVRLMIRVIPRPTAVARTQLQES